MNILITGAWREAQKYIPQIERLGHKVFFLKNEIDKLPCENDCIEGIIGNGIFLSHDIKSFSNLRYIQLTSAGYDRVPIDYIKAKSIEIYNARGVYGIPIAEMALTGVLCLYKKIGAFIDNKGSHLWEKQRDLLEIYNKQVAVIGCGNIGTECAKRFKALGARVSGVDVNEVYNPVYDEIYLIEDFDRAVENADIVLVSLPLNDETKHFIDSSKFKTMKPGAIFVNISRGEVVKTDHLIDALKKKLGGAVLDVFEEEPLKSDSPLWDMENVFITPHNSFVGDGNEKRLSDLIISNLSQAN